MAKLNTFVVVHDDNGSPHTFGPDDSLPKWAEKAITNPNVWDGKAPKQADDSAEAAEKAKADSAAAEKAKADEAAAAKTAGDEIPEPARTGKGSGLEEWKAYAAHLGIEVPAESKRDDIVALVDAGEPTE